MFNFASQNQSLIYEHDILIDDSKFIDQSCNEKDAHIKSSSKPGTPRRSWSPYEDHLVLKLVEKHGLKWRALAEGMNGVRTSKQIRDRWNNKLDPSIAKAEWSLEEQNLLLSLFHKHGRKWCAIAKLMPGRSESMVKNFFYSHFRKLLGDQSVQKHSTKNLKSVVSDESDSLNLEREDDNSRYQDLSEFLDPIKKVKCGQIVENCNYINSKDFELAHFYPQNSINLLDRQRNLLESLSSLEKNVYRKTNLNSVLQGHKLQSNNNYKASNLQNSDQCNNQEELHLEGKSSFFKADIYGLLHRPENMESDFGFYDLLEQAPFVNDDPECDRDLFSTQKNHLDSLKEYCASFDSLFPDIQIPDSIRDAADSTTTLTEL